MKMYALLAVLTLVPAAGRAEEVRIAMHDGVVSVTAKDATVRQILAEWAKVGQTTIVNADQVTGAPVSLQIVNVPEEQALDVILRSVSGYVAAPRVKAAANLSRFDRILITPTSTPAASAPPRAVSPPAGFPAGRVQQAPNGDADDDGPAPNAPPPAPPLNQRPPIQPPQVPRAFPTPVPAPAPAPNGEPQSGDPNGATPAPYNSPTAGAPVGVSTPGMVVQPPPQPGQPAPAPR